MPRQRKDFFFNPVVITIIAIIAVIAVFHFYQNSKKINHLENKIKKIENQIANAEARNRQLKDQIENSDSNEYIEEVAREKLGLIKKGEKLLIPIEEKSEDDKKDN